MYAATRRAKPPRADLAGYQGDCYLGIDSGSTTVKAVLLDDQGRLLSSMYKSNSGNPVPIIRDYLLDLFRQYPHLRIKSGAVTGYGEELMKNAFAMDYGHCRNGGPLHRGQNLYARRGFRHRHRRPGYEVL